MYLIRHQAAMYLIFLLFLSYVAGHRYLVPILSCQQQGYPSNYRLDIRTGRHCYEAGRKGPCGDKEVLFVTVGDQRLYGDCLCATYDDQVTIAYWPPERQCYRINSKGPCERGHLFTPTPTGQGECRPDPCYDPSQPHQQVLLNGTCYTEGERGPCEEGQTVSMEGYPKGFCRLSTSPFVNLLLPKVTCPPGMVFTDTLGGCRETRTFGDGACAPGTKWHPVTESCI